jgi:acetyltransferase-like isoleucine patch superfamily enzyme
MHFTRRICYLLFLITRYFDNSIILKLRRILVNCFLAKTITNLFIRSNVLIFGYRNLKLGNDVSIHHGCFLSCEGGVTIGNFVSIAHGTSILSSEHSYEDNSIPIKYQPVKYAAINICDDVWIGANVTILAGVSLAKGTIVAAGSVVTKSVEDEDTIIAGVPARHLKGRYNG